MCGSEQRRGATAIFRRWRWPRPAAPADAARLFARDVARWWSCLRSLAAPPGRGIVPLSGPPRKGYGAGDGSQTPWNDRAGRVSSRMTGHPATPRVLVIDDEAAVR